MLPNTVVYVDLILLMPQGITWWLPALHRTSNSTLGSFTKLNEKKQLILPSYFEIKLAFSYAYFLMKLDNQFAITGLFILYDFWVLKSQNNKALYDFKIPDIEYELNFKKENKLFSQNLRFLVVLEYAAFVCQD